MLGYIIWCWITFFDLYHILSYVDIDHYASWFFYPFQYLCRVSCHYSRIMSFIEVWQRVQYICSLLQDWQWCLQFRNAWKIVLWFLFFSPRQLKTELLSIRLELFTLIIVKNGITRKKALFVTFLMALRVMFTTNEPLRTPIHAHDSL